MERAELIALIHRGEIISDQDFSGRDLAGADLSGAILDVNGGAFVGP